MAMMSSIVIGCRRNRRRYNSCHSSYMTCAFLLSITWLNLVGVWRVHALIVPVKANYLNKLLLSRISTTTTTTTTTTILLMSSSSPPPRQPRRMLKKRRRKDGDNNNKRRFIANNNNNNNLKSSPWNNSSNNNNNNYNNEDTTTTEYRPLVSSVRRDLGEDYWIDPADLEKERQQQQQRQLQLRQRPSNVIPPEKLWSEVKAPYQQNWIGYYSVFIAILSMIILKFPELLDTPTIPYPDL
jgi:hypothetical protein